MIIRKQYTAVTIGLLLFLSKNVEAQQHVVSRQTENMELAASELRLAILPADHMQENFAARWPQAMVKAEKIEQVPSNITMPQHAINRIGNQFIDSTLILTWQHTENGTTRESRIVIPYLFEVARFVGVTHDNEPILEGRFKEGQFFCEDEWRKRLYGSLQRSEQLIFLKLSSDDRAWQAARDLSETEQTLLDSIATNPSWVHLTKNQAQLFNGLPQEIQDNLKNNGSLTTLWTQRERCKRATKEAITICSIILFIAIPGGFGLGQLLK